MSYENEKLERFSNAVNEEIEVQIQQIIADAEASKNELIEKANDSSLSIAYDKIKEEIKKTQSKFVRIISKAELESKREILLFRENISSKVIENVKTSLIKFTSSEKYKSFLISLAKKSIENYSDEKDIVFYISSSDMKFKDEIENSFGENVVVEESNKIKLGGIRIFLKNKNILIDKTLDIALQENKEQFNNSESLRLN